MGGRKRIIFEVEEALYNELKRLAKENRVTMSSILRHLIISYLLGNKPMPMESWVTKKKLEIEKSLREVLLMYSIATTLAIISFVLIGVYHSIGSIIVPLAIALGIALFTSYVIIFILFRRWIK